MLGPTHALFGATAYVALPLAGVPAPLAGVGWAAGAALLPDIDHPSSTVSQFLGPVARGFRWITGAKHRGLTHRWPFALIVTLAVALIEPWLLIPIGVGYSSHLIGDQIPRTGGWLEKRLVRPGLWLALPLILTARLLLT